MEELASKIAAFQKISEQLEPSEVDRKDYLTQLANYSSSFIDTLDQTKTYSDALENNTILQLDGTQKSFNELLRIYATEVAAKGINAASGGHLGYIPGGGIFTAALGDFLADITNEYAGMHYASPGAVGIENALIDWMKSIFGFPKSAIGNLTSGGSIANLIALTAARDKFGIKSERVSTSVIYMSEQVHHCIHKALRIIGLEDVIIRHIDLDENSRMQADDFAKKLALDRTNGLHPFLVIASAGTTDTGAVDPLAEIGTIAKSNELWYHIDAAYGGFFILTPSKKERFSGIELADSLVIDPHKGLFLPYGLGAVLVKDVKAVYHSNFYRASYMQDVIVDESPINPADVSPELTKPFRGLRLWVPLQLHGIEPFVACLEEKLLLTKYFREKLKELGFKLGPEPDLSVSYFWFPVNEGDENDFNENLMKAIHKDGEIFLSSTIIKGKFVIRMAILSFRTKLETIDTAIAMINRTLIRMQNYRE